ncbi:NUDIX hydrolase [Mangrovibacterium diazotrophicum]|uniref:8-oxo-dGTP pyrophosphatase MutT (NUDIX family) n=1 Tax=Mangrovibacterium diazotrophicum TaxID=1261403 RepID=A0A419W822_9BACT|nr:NUDIX domain-containing protein [Mangrovibacterium diazotrophicum]RKD91606.1 8-oxo-dGTP pyrophosphatase MutT (NUDIX family) [Mangrovibacterium diazotrophicum]
MLIEHSTNNSVLAGGGILWRGEPFLSELAVIHRTRYGGEWLLPKGKQEPGEKLEETALREVSEETACTAKLVSFADFLQYKIGEKEKLVFFWHMQLVEENVRTRDKEADQLLWLPVEAASKLLTYDEQKKLIVRSGTSLRAPVGESQEVRLAKGDSRQTWRSRMKHFRGGNKIRKSRLQGSITTSRKRMESKLESCLKPKLQHLYKGIELLKTAEFYLNGNELDIAWKCFHESQRQEILTLDSEPLLAEAKVIRSEAEKIGGWRQAAIEELLGKKGELIPPGLSNESVYQAAQIRDEHFNNNAYKDQLFQRYLSTILVCLVVSAFLVFAYLYYAHWCSSPLSFLPPIFGVVGFGIFGGAFSTLLKIPPERGSSRIPEQVYASRLSLIRVFIGGASALILYVFIQAGLVLQLDGFDNKPDNLFLLYVISFAAGFSERLVLKTVMAVTKE